MAATAGARVATRRSKTTTITFWDAYSSDGPEVKRLEKVLIPQFEKEHPGIVVKDVTIPYDSLPPEADHGGRRLAAAGPRPLGHHLGAGAREPRCAAAARHDTADFKSISSKVFAGPLATNYWKGHYYGLPLDTNTRILVYSPLRAAGGRHLRRRRRRSRSCRPMSADCQGARARTSTPSAARAAGTSARGSGRTAATSRTATYTKATGYLNGAEERVRPCRCSSTSTRPAQMPNIVVDSNGGLGTYDGLHAEASTRRSSTGPWIVPDLRVRLQEPQLAGHDRSGRCRAAA